MANEVDETHDCKNSVSVRPIMRNREMMRESQRRRSESIKVQHNPSVPKFLMSLASSRFFFFFFRLNMYLLNRPLSLTKAIDGQILLAWYQICGHTCPTFEQRMTGTCTKRGLPPPPPAW